MLAQGLQLTRCANTTDRLLRGRSARSHPNPLFAAIFQKKGQHLSGDIHQTLAQLSESALAAGSNGRAALNANPEYLEFRNEVNRLNSPSLSEVPDWKKIEKMTLALAGLAGDLMVYFHLCMAVVNTRGYPALTSALNAFNQLMENGWDLLIPAKQRSQYFKTFSLKLALQLKTRGPDKDYDALKSCDAALQKMGELLRSNGAEPLIDAMEVLQGHIAKLAPAVAPSPVVEDKAVSPPVVEPDPPKERPALRVVEKPAEPEAAPRQAPPPPPRTVADAGGSGDASLEGKNRQVLERELAVLVERLTALQRQEDITSPTPYRLLRAVLWASAREPVADKQDKTRVPPPQPHQLKKLTQAVTEPQAREVIRETEEWVRSYPLWLDLQLRVVQALELVGAHDAAGAVKQELASLLSRLPALLNLKFSSGVGFASEETQAWCRSFVGKTGVVAAGPVPVAAVVMQAPSSPVQAVVAPPVPAPSPALPVQPPVVPVSIAYAPVEIPRVMVSATDEGEVPVELGSALVVLHQRAQRIASPRRRFELRIQMVDACLRHARVDLAGPLVDELEQALVSHQLEKWDPELTVLVLRQKLIVARALGGDEAARTRRIELWQRICQLNPAEAVALGSET